MELNEVENKKDVSPRFVDFLKLIIEQQRIEMEKIALIQVKMGIVVIKV
jgi:hypothetical protein